MPRRTTISLAFAIAACTHGASGAPEPVPAPVQWVDAAGRRNGRIGVGDTYVHYIDYGGTGRAIVLLAGLGASAHVYDGFAPKLAERGHVVALTRRGYGESGRPADGYDDARLADDVVAAIDSLGLGRVVLVGHAEAGDELTTVAIGHPDRVAALVYLEAAYDRSSTSRRLIAAALDDRLPPTAPRATARDRASPDAYRDYLSRITGVEWPMSDVRATRVFDADGSYRREGTDPRVTAKIVRAARAPEYARIAAPVLAIYATERGLDRDYPWIGRLPSRRAEATRRAAAAQRAEEEYAAAERRRLAASLPRARIVTIARASRYLYLSDPDRVVAEIAAFLNGN